MEEHARSINRRVFLGGAAAFGVVSLANPLVAFATPTAAEKQAEADQIRLQVNGLKNEVLEKANAYGAALDEHDRAVAAMEEAQNHIDALNEEILGLQDKLGTRARSMYRNGSTSFLDILLGAATFEEFATNWDFLNKMNKDDANMVSGNKVLREDLEATKAEYVKEEQIAAQKLAEAKEAKEETESAANHYQAILDTLDAETRELLIQEQEQAAVVAATRQVAQDQRTPSRSTSAPTSNNDSQVTNDSYEEPAYIAPAPVDYGPPATSVLSAAMKYIGCAYTAAGTSPETGFDCSGLVYYCHMEAGRALPPRSTYGYSSSGWFPVSEAQPGDVLWQPNHVGICASAGGGSYIHAADESLGVCYGSSPQFSRAYRF